MWGDIDRPPGADLAMAPPIEVLSDSLSGSSWSAEPDLSQAGMPPSRKVTLGFFFGKEETFGSFGTCTYARETKVQVARYPSLVHLPRRKETIWHIATDLWRILMGTSENVAFLVASSGKGSIDVKIGSSIVHIPNHCSVQNRVVQMILFAKMSNARGNFRCPRSLARKAILDIAKKSSSDDACNTDFPTAYNVSVDLEHEEECNFKKNPKTYALASPQSPTPSDGTLTPAILLDSGTSHHVAGDAGILTDLHDPPARSTVVVADGFGLPVHKVGVIQTPDIRIPDVYFVPGLRVNLISVRQLAKSRVVTTFYENHAELWREGEQVGGAIADNDTSLYRLVFFTPWA